jgi:16S rRNA (cytosine1402-N4)-methyltransferase
MAGPVLKLLDPAPGQVALDCTAGRGGHAELLARAVGPLGTVVLLDLDAGNLAFARERLGSMVDGPRVIGEHANFAQAASVLDRHGLQADVVLADLGFASSQMGDPLRGMAFSADGPLDMRLDTSQILTAEALLHRIDERELADMIFELGEDPFSRRIARSIVERRNEGRLRSTGDLAEAVIRAYGPRARSSRVHPATRTFMAIRIAVNRELESLDALLSDFGHAIAAMAKGERSVLAPGARIAFLAFHSLEDRSIKRTFVDWDRQGWVTRLTRKPMVAEPEEQAHNPRARSAKLRAVRVQVAAKE